MASAMIGGEVRGWEALRERLNAMGPKAMESGRRALYHVALKIRGLSMAMAPVDTTALKNSHEMPETGIDSDGDAFARLNVGGPAAPYAVFVHEDLTARHDVGQAKFLEYALLAYKPDMAEEIGRELDLGEGLG